MVNRYWVILVARGYGGFLFDGTKGEAEEMRLVKSRSEQAVAKKRLATPQEIESDIIDCCWNHPNFKHKFKYRCDCDKCNTKDGAK